MNGFATAWAVVGAVVGAALVPATRRLMYRRPGLTALGVVTVPATAAAFALIAWRWPSASESLALSVFAATAVQLAAIDAVEQRLPRALVWPMSVATLGILAANAFVHSGAAGSLVRAITGAALLAALHLIAAVTTRGGIGSGDVRLAVPVGLILGWHSWSALATGTVLGLISTSVAAVVTRTFDRGKGGTMPHGPGMLIGAFIATLT